MREVMSPYGGEEVLVEEVPVGWLVHEYHKKSGIDVAAFFSGIEHISLGSSSYSL